MADELAKAKVPWWSTRRCSGSAATWRRSTRTSPARGVLAAKKIPLAMGTGFEGYVPKTRVLRHEAAVARGLRPGPRPGAGGDHAGAAKVLGIADTRGSIDQGQDRRPGALRRRLLRAHRPRDAHAHRGAHRLRPRGVPGAAVRPPVAALSSGGGGQGAAWACGNSSVFSVQCSANSLLSDVSPQPPASSLNTEH